MRTKTTLAIGAAFLLTLGAAVTPLAAQESTVAEEITVDEVALDALVTDRRGDIVVGLDEDDFVVKEDGQPVDIQDVTFYSNRRFLETKTSMTDQYVAIDNVPTNRYFILFFDDPRRFLPRLATQTLDAGRWASRWAETSLQPNDYVAVVRFDYDLVLLQDFTNDSEKIDQAIDDAVTGKEPEHTGAPSKGAPSLAAHWPDDSELRSVDRIYGALEATARAADPIPGRKNLALFSIGFGDDDDPFYSPDPRYFPDLVQGLNDANVAVYAIDLVPFSPFGSLRTNVLGNSLSHLASETGGRYYYHFASFQTPLEQMTEQTNGYYLLTYRSRHPAGESGYQDVTVDTVNPRFHVQAREGYRYGEG